MIQAREYREGRTMGVLFFILYFGFGIIQCSAIFSGYAYKLGNFFGFILALFSGQMPVIGTVMGIIGAHKAWGWSIVKSILLFILPFILMIIMGYILNKKEKRK